MEIDIAKESLAGVDPTDVKTITLLQNTIARHANFNQWLMEVIGAGRAAYDDYLSSEE